MSEQPKEQKPKEGESKEVKMSDKFTMDDPDGIIIRRKKKPAKSAPKKDDKGKAKQ